MVVLVLAAGCGGGDDDGATCSPSPRFNSTPPTTATVGQQYRYDVDFTMACVPFVIPCSFELIQGPPGAGVTSPGVVFWTPGQADAGMSRQFTIQTRADLCGDRATQSWSVSVQ